MDAALEGTTGSPIPPLIRRRGEGWNSFIDSACRIVSRRLGELDEVFGVSKCGLVLGEFVGVNDLDESVGCHDDIEIKIDLRDRITVPTRHRSDVHVRLVFGVVAVELDDPRLVDGDERNEIHPRQSMRFVGSLDNRVGRYEHPRSVLILAEPHGIEVPMRCIRPFSLIDVNESHGCLFDSAPD